MIVHKGKSNPASDSHVGLGLERCRIYSLVFLLFPLKILHSLVFLVPTSTFIVLFLTATLRTGKFYYLATGNFCSDTQLLTSLTRSLTTVRYINQLDTIHNLESERPPRSNFLSATQFVKAPVTALSQWC
jgi:hypothetical protein